MAEVLRGTFPASRHRLLLGGLRGWGRNLTEGNKKSSGASSNQSLTHFTEEVIDALESALGLRREIATEILACILESFGSSSVIWVGSMDL